MQIHISRDGQTLGQFTLEDVNARLAAGGLRPGDLAWAEGRSEWTPLSAFPGVAASSPTAPPPGMPAIPPPLQKIPPLLNPPASGLAITSLVCGILSVTMLPLLTSIPAIVCGHMAQGRIKREPGVAGGGGMAMAGLIMGYLSFALVIPMIAILAGIALPVFSQVQLKGKQVKSLAQARQIAIGCKIYADDHDGAFPKTLDELVPEFVTREVFICPLSPPGETMGYIYFGGKETDPADKVLIVSKAADRRGKRVVVHVDGSGAIEPYTPSLESR